MSLDGKPQTISRVITNDRPIHNEVRCECGGYWYAAPSARYATCTGGEIRCVICHRPAHRFGKAYTCGFGCRPHG